MTRDDHQSARALRELHDYELDHIIGGWDFLFEGIASGMLGVDIEATMNEILEIDYYTFDSSSWERCFGPSEPLTQAALPGTWPASGPSAYQNTLLWAMGSAFSAAMGPGVGIVASGAVNGFTAMIQDSPAPATEYPSFMDLGGP